MADTRELWNRLEVILDLAVAAVSGCGQLVPSSSVEYDDQVMDECDCRDGTGHVYVRVNRIFPTGVNGVRFPQQSLQPTNCPGELAAEIRLGIWRCVANLDSQNRGPGYAQRTADARKIIVDASVLYNVLLSHNPVWANFPLVIQGWTQLNQSEGACSGGYWTFYADAALCDCGPGLPD